MTSRRVSSQQETQTTIDHGERDEYTAEPEMCMRPGSAPAMFAESRVVRHAQNGLEEDEAEDDEADDGVRVFVVVVVV